MKNKGLLGFVIIFVALLVGGFFFYIGYFGLERESGFEEDGEKCVRVDTECCSCSSGGEEVCVLKEEAENYGPENCSETMFCAHVYNCNPGTCDFVDGECSFVE